QPAGNRSPAGRLILFLCLGRAAGHVHCPILRTQKPSVLDCWPPDGATCFGFQVSAHPRKSECLGPETAPLTLIRCAWRVLEPLVRGIQVIRFAPLHRLVAPDKPGLSTI